MGIECNCSTISVESGIKGLELGFKNQKNGNINCYKCGRPAIISCRENSCKECFIKVFSKNFRSNLRTKCLEDKDSNRILSILYNGSFVSSSLLYLILDRNNDRHLKDDNNRDMNNNNNSKDNSINSNEDDNMNRDNYDFSFRKLTDSDDLKLRYLVNVKNPLDEDDDYDEDDYIGKNKEMNEQNRRCITNSKEYFRVIQSIFNKFTNKYKFEMYNESSCIVEYLINNVKLVNMRSCYFLHKQNTIDECNNICYEFIAKCKKLFKEDPDFGYHIWRIIRLINLKTYFKINKQNKIYLVMPETQDDICKKALYLTCIGLGGEVNYRCSFVDRITIEGFRILRPLKNFTLKELAFYNKFNELEQVLYKSKTQFNFGTNSSIFGCISFFTNELNLQHSNTFHNITNITNRLIDNANKQIDGIKKGCSICKVLLNLNKHNNNDQLDEEEDEKNKKNKLDIAYNTQKSTLESNDMCKGCQYFSIKHYDMLEYFKGIFYNNN